MVIISYKLFYHGLDLEGQHGLPDACLCNFISLQSLTHPPCSIHADSFQSLNLPCSPSSRALAFILPLPGALFPLSSYGLLEPREIID